MSFVGTLITGARLSLCDPANYLKQIAVSGAATASIVPALLVRLLDEEYPWPDCLKYLVTAAAPLDSDLAARFYRRYGPRLRQGYGLSEAVNFSFMMPELDAGDFADQYVRRTPPVGLPLPGTEFRIEEGEVLLRSRDMMRGYWGDAEETARRIGETGWLRTGDLGELRDGLLVLRGRRDEIINYGGEKRYPLDIETQWRAAGLSGAFAAVPVSGAHLGTDVGLVLDEEAVAARVLYRAGSAILPAAAESAHVARTATGKLRRVWMGSRLSSMHDSGARYSELFRYAHAVAREIAASPYPPLTSRAGRVHAQAVALAACEPPAEAPVSAARSVAHDALDLLAATWPDLAAGDCDGSAMMHRRPGLWQRLMNEWPMNTYAHHVVQLLRRRGPEGPLLEIGSGVGNTTSLLAPLISGELVWSDRNPDLVRRGRWRDRGVVFDFDHDAPPGLGGFGVIVATNALHCAADKVRTLRTLRSMLRDDGTLVLGEGASPTTSDGLPWCLDFLFCAFDGWGDRSGFLSRWEWLVLLHEAGFVRSGYGVLRAGRFDLGGVIWGISDGE
jgi:SAM-dependent methyltransferase